MPRQGNLTRYAGEPISREVARARGFRLWRRFGSAFLEALRGEAGALDEGAQFGPGEVGVDAAAETAIGAGDDIFAAGDLDEPEDTVGDELRVLVMSAEFYGGRPDVSGSAQPGFAPLVPVRRRVISAGISGRR